MVQIPSDEHKAPAGVFEEVNEVAHDGTFVFLNGRLKPAGAPLIRADDAGFLYGHGAFETLRICAGRVIGWPRHHARLQATLVRLRIEASVAAARGQIEELAVLNQVGPEGRARLTITAGSGAGATCLVTTQTISARMRRRRCGIALVTADVPRGFADLKTLDWLGPRLAFASHAGEVEPLRRAGDDVLEGASTNVFCATPSGVITPPADGRLLPGTARAVLIEVLARLGVPCRVEPLAFATLATHGGVVTNALLPLAPIEAVDGAVVPQVAWLDRAREVFDDVAG
ncbi:MAG: branched-subunit amino acid aminotransferase/4-amino-4-deoxychorismate lyase [Bradymonadia bacterium]|jgi:branched-subunit amino acid aminotransferase/4-amino-4-deoxychorismate lyase